MSANLLSLARTLEAATSYVDIFGGLKDEPNLKSAVTKQYRTLAAQVHPDKNPAAEHDLAETAFQRLGELHKAALTAICENRYGVLPTIEVTTKRNSHNIGAMFASGDVAELFTGTSSSRKTREEYPSIFKVARSPRDADLIQNEAKVLRRLHSSPDDGHFHPYFPEILESFRLNAGGVRRQVNVTKNIEGLVSLVDVRRSYPDGVHPLDMAWMWRRLLDALSYSHDSGILHGAILPSHTLIHAEHHGLVLIDWIYASTKDEGPFPIIKAISPEYREWYPQSVLDKKIPDVGTDLVMAVKTMIYLLGGDPLLEALPSKVPTAFKAYFNGALSVSRSSSPMAALDLLIEFDELLERLGEPYYPRRFRPFKVN